MEETSPTFLPTEPHCFFLHILVKSLTTCVHVANCCNHGLCSRLDYVPCTGTKILTPSSVKVTLFGNKVLVDDHVRRRLLGWALVQWHGESHSGIKTETKAIHLHAKAQGTQDKKLGWAGRDSQALPSEGTSVPTLSSDFRL